MTAPKETAIHEAGHAVAFYRLFGDAARYGHTLTIEPHEDLLGSHRAEELVFHGVGELTAEQRLAFENEAIYSCASYAALLAAVQKATTTRAAIGCKGDDRPRFSATEIWQAAFAHEAVSQKTRKTKS